MAKSSPPSNRTPTIADIHALAHEASRQPSGIWSTGPGQSPGQRPALHAGGPAVNPVPAQKPPQLPNVPAAPGVAAGATTDLVVSWSAPAADATHDAATGFNVRYSAASAGNWNVVSGVASPYYIAGLPGSSPFDVQVQATNAAGVSAWSPTTTRTTNASGPQPPNAPAIASVGPLMDGTAMKLAVAWSAPATDASHGAATGYNLRYSPAGLGSWTTLFGVTSPATLTGLSGAAAFDVEVQGTNAAPSPGGWSAIVSGTTWGATVTPGAWVPATTQTHGAGVAPNGGVQAFATPAPTAVSGASFAWSSGNTQIPTTGLIAAGPDGQTNGWGQFFNAPATAGTWYLWTLATGAGGTTVGASVTAAITVT